MEPVVNDRLRTQIAALCRRRSVRSSTFTSEEPTVWRPQTIENPRTGLYFSDDSAWELIAALVEAGHEVRVVSLRKPPGAVGYELTYEIPNGSIYMKFQLSPGRNLILGRSFHWSDRS